MLPCGSTPPKLGGVAAPSRKCREASLAGADGVVLSETTPSRLIKRRRATPPNLGGELLFGCFATFVFERQFPELISTDVPPHLIPGNLEITLPVLVIPASAQSVVIELSVDDVVIRLAAG